MSAQDQIAPETTSTAGGNCIKSTHQHLESSCGNAGVVPPELLLQLLLVLLAGVAGPNKPDGPSYQRQGNSACKGAPHVGD